MLDIEIIRKDPDKVRTMLKERNMDVSLVDQFLDLDEKWRKQTTQLQELQRLQKEYSAARDIEKAKENKVVIKEAESLVTALQIERDEKLLEFPNIFFDDVVRGGGEDGNVEIKRVGDIPEFSFAIKDHLELGEGLGIIDVKKAAQVSGSRFYYLRGKGALLEFALIRFAIDHLTKAGFEPIIPPVMIRPDMYKKMGRLTDAQKEERYYLGADDLYLVGSAEHTLGPLYSDSVFEEADLPKRLVGFSSCFRREAGSYGKDVKGILRVHQFDKVEMYAFTTPQNSEDEHAFLLSLQEGLWKVLGIPYRVVSICSGDMGPTDARQFDIEAWIPSQQQYREVASCSNTTDYQTRGIGTKVSQKDGPVFVHALNATALAIGRTIVAILENFQQEDGSVHIPEKLAFYTGFDSIVRE